MLQKMLKMVTRLASSKESLRNMLKFVSRNRSEVRGVFQYTFTFNPPPPTNKKHKPRDPAILEATILYK